MSLLTKNLHNYKIEDIYLNEWELKEDRVISILETTADDGKNYKTTFYNLDMIIIY